MPGRRWKVKEVASSLTWTNSATFITTSGTMSACSWSGIQVFQRVKFS